MPQAHPVLDWIEDSYKLPLQFMPSPFEQGNHKSALDHHCFVTDSIQELIRNRCVREAQGNLGMQSPVCGGQSGRQA